jgi:predicted nucleotidyltransferase
MRKMIMQISYILKETLPYIKNKYDIEELEIFGSYVRGEDTNNSDIDLLVSFSNTPSLIKFIELENYLSGVIGIKVHLVMKNSLKKNLRHYILREARPI